MKQTKKNILAVAGVISSVVGIVFAIPSVLQERYVIAVISTIFIIGGLVLLAIAFGD